MRQRLRISRSSRATLSCLFAAGLVAGTAQAADASARERGEHRGAHLVAQAVAYEHGEGVERDPARAAVLYCEAARLGNLEGMHALAWMYANGRGLPRNDGYAGALFAMAAAKGDEHAKRMLRFTGRSDGKLPECLREPRKFVAAIGAGSSLESRINALSTERQRVARLVLDLAPDYQVSPQFALAIALAESALNPLAVSPKNAMGVMQLIPDTAARFNVRNPFDAKENIRGGLAYLRWLLAYFTGDVALAAAAYNAGEGNVDRYRGVPPFPETRAYVERILSFVEQRQHPFDSKVVAPSAALKLIRVSADRAEGS